MRAAWLGSSPRRTSKTGRVDARGKITCRPRLSIVLKRPSYRRESELAPRDFPPFEKPDFEALRSGLDGLVQQASTIDQLHLADPRNVVNRQQSFDLDPRPRLFPRLALGSGAGRFVELKIASGQGLITVARVDRATAQQNAFTPSRDRADNDLRVIVENVAAFGADHALAVVAFGDASNRRAAEEVVVRHRGSRSRRDGPFRSPAVWRLSTGVARALLWQGHSAPSRWINFRPSGDNRLRPKAGQDRSGPLSVADDMSGFGSRRSVRFLEGLQTGGSGCDPRYGWRGISKGWSVIGRGD